MDKRFWNTIGFLLVMNCIFLSACQPALAPAPTRAADTATPAPTATPIPATATPAPTATKPGGITFSPKWEFETGGPVWGNPTVSEGVVYFGSDDQNLYALDAKTKDLKWKFATQGIVRSQPALANGLVFISSDDGFVYALKSGDGSQAWRTDIGNLFPRDQREALGSSPAPTGYDYVQSSPVAADGRIFAGSLDGMVYALAADTGVVIWRYKTGEKVRSTPVVADGVVYVGSWDKNMYALSAKTGVLIWKTPIGGQVQSKAVVAEGLVITASRKASVVALDVKTGNLVWEHNYGSNLWVESSPWLDNGIVYIGSSGSNIVLGLQAKTGKPYTIFQSKSFNWSTPIGAGGILYIGGATANKSGKAGMFVFKLEDGKIPDIFNETYLFSLQDTKEASGTWSGVTSSPALAGGVLYFGSLDGKLYAVAL